VAMEECGGLLGVSRADLVEDRRVLVGFLFP
jgi:hypothetical protein